jgi:hypothetical protein
MIGIQKEIESPFFVSMATAEKFVQPISIFLAYLVPLYVDGVPCKCHYFCVFQFFLAFWPFHGNGDHFENSKS